MSTSRQSLYQRLPEFYHIRDKEQQPPYQLKAYLDILDEVFAEIRNNMESLYDDFFIDTCSDWVVPYIADLLGTTHLSGEPWTLRADVANTIYHRRRKGTLGAIESLTYSLSGWAAHTVELQKRITWNQHLNHQRSDAGGKPPIPIYIDKLKHISGAVRGGTINLRDPAHLSLFNQAFDPFAHLLDVKPIDKNHGCPGMLNYNFPNLVIFLWRLQDYTLPVNKPEIEASSDIIDLTADVSDDEAPFVIRVDIHPLAEPMVLFNTHRYYPNAEPPNLTDPDAIPGSMPSPRLTTGAVSGNPDNYISMDFYTDTGPGSRPNDPGQNHVGLVIHLPEAFSVVPDWHFRGANLCAWEVGLKSRLKIHEIAVDPEHGRLIMGAGGASISDEAEALASKLYLSSTYAFSGSTTGTTGAHSISRIQAPSTALKVSFEKDHNDNPAPGGIALQIALADLPDLGLSRVIEIQDSRTYELDLAVISGIGNDGSRNYLSLRYSLHIRASSGQRPIIRLKQPLAFRPHDITSAGAAGKITDLNVVLEGLYITWDKTSAEFASMTALIEQAAINRLTIRNCTLDPGNHRALDKIRQPIRYAFNLSKDYLFTAAEEQTNEFNQIPKIEVLYSICGPMAIAENYVLKLQGSIVDAMVESEPSPVPLAIHAPVDPESDWGPDLHVSGMTCFGRMRVSSATGKGSIWVHRLEVHDDQTGCIKFSYFSGDHDRLPQHQACVFASSVYLSFVSKVFGEAGYAQLSLRCDRRLLEQGPERDQMGVYGYLLNTHKWKNINIRYREFIPVGVQPVLIPVT